MITASGSRGYGVEKTVATVQLAKMNLVLNNVRGTITHANSYYCDPYDSFGNFDYVMANPPFNVDGVELDQVKDQPRFNTYGVPQNKTKNKKKDAKETVPNGNYLWINQFATALNDISLQKIHPKRYRFECIFCRDFAYIHIHQT